MYPSGVWRGFWQQEFFGKQPMEDFHLRFRGGTIDGHGVDVVGRFVFHGEYDAAGAVRLVKQYLGRHRVLYEGGSDGEGSIVGKWTMPAGELLYTGPFVLQPVVGKARGDEPITEITA